MAKTVGSAILGAVHGRVGNVVIRQGRNGTVVARRPQPRYRRRATERQAAQRERFARAVAYAHRALEDPALRALYAARVQGTDRTPFNAAVADYSTPPSVDAVSLSAYHGRPGDVIRIRATDDAGVARVTVEIRTRQGALIEEGAA